MSDEPENKPFETWAIVELMGHIKIAGLVTEEERFGTKLGRCDIPGPNDTIYATQYFAGGSIYRVTPTTKEIATQVALQYQPRPATQLTHSPVSFAEDYDPNDNEPDDLFDSHGEE